MPTAISSEIRVEEVARLGVELGARTDTVVMDAVGPQSVTFRWLVDAVCTAVGSHAVVVPVLGRVPTGPVSRIGPGSA